MRKKYREFSKAVFVCRALVCPLYDVIAHPVPHYLFVSQLICSMMMRLLNLPLKIVEGRGETRSTSPRTEF
jgi:hypothetical protein